ncbi:MerR family transcriptional regulator [Streptomyces sp. NPDC101209]|uniref:MerR family transcriptional regulator n=1 Tax=Streptomyces sp. NPDC101209 TaxID=3366129 RepID=UPI003807DE2C
MARRSGFSEPTLRYYEKTGLLGVVAREDSSGHRRYGPATVERVLALSWPRSSGMTVTGMRHYLDLRARGDAAAAKQHELFAAHADRLAAEIDRAASPSRLSARQGGPVGRPGPRGRGRREAGHRRRHRRRCPARAADLPVS